MAKAVKSTDKPAKTVPPAELVGDHASNPKFYSSPVPIPNDVAGAADFIAADNAEQFLGEAEDHALPLLEQACEAFMLEHGHSDIQCIRITAKDDGLRRAGLRHVGKVDHPVTTFTGIQLEQLLAEKQLIVEFIASEA